MRKLHSAAVRIPCSTSNLGAGFDCVGLALDRYLEASFRPTASGGLELVREGTLSELRVPAENDLTARAFLDQVREVVPKPSGVLEVTSAIPIGKGLGASAAAVLAGFDLGRAALGLDRDDRTAFRYALRVEGHGDNAAPSLLGGLRAVIPGGMDDEGDQGSPLVAELELSARIGFAFAAPGHALPTQKARRSLPASVPHAVAVRSAARSVALVRGLATGDPELLRRAVADELHAPYRLPLLARSAEALERGYAAGAWAVTTSGAGSGLIAMCPPERSNAVADAMRQAFSNHASNQGNGTQPEGTAGNGRDPRTLGDLGGCVGFSLRPDGNGLVRLS